MFAQGEAGALLPVGEPYDVPVFGRVKVHRLPHRGQQGTLLRAESLHWTYLDVRADLP